MALIAAITFSAFRPQAEVKKTNLDQHYYRFMSNDPNDLLNESEYEFIGDELPTPLGCPDGQLSCIIQAEGDENEPDFTASGISDEEDVEAATVAWKVRP